MGRCHAGRDSKVAAARIDGVFDIHVLVHVAVFLSREAEAVGGGVVQVAVQLHEQQQAAGIDQAGVGEAAEQLERLPLAPQLEQGHHAYQRGDLADLDADVEAQDAHQDAEVVVTQRQLLQPGRQAETMQQAETEHGRQQIRRLHAEVQLETAVVVEALVDHAEGDHGVDQVVVPGDLEEGRKDQRDAVAQGKDGDELRHLLERGQEEHHAEQEQQVVVAREHMAGTQPDVLQVAAIEHALAVLGRDAVSPGQQGHQGQGSGKEPPGQSGVHQMESLLRGGHRCRSVAATGPSPSMCSAQTGSASIPSRTGLSDLSCRPAAQHCDQRCDKPVLGELSCAVRARRTAFDQAQCLGGRKGPSM